MATPPHTVPPPSSPRATHPPTPARLAGKAVRPRPPEPGRKAQSSSPQPLFPFPIISVSFPHALLLHPGLSPSLPRQKISGPSFWVPPLNYSFPSDSPLPQVWMASESSTAGPSVPPLPHTHPSIFLPDPPSTVPGPHFLGGASKGASHQIQRQPFPGPPHLLFVLLKVPLPLPPLFCFLCPPMQGLQQGLHMALSPSL